jgi:hypothetical protein
VRGVALAVGMLAAACGDARGVHRADEPDELRLLGATVRFASAEEAAVILGTEDDFTRALSAFDRGFRMNTLSDTTPEAFLEHAAAQARAWSEPRMRRWRGAIAELAPALEGLELALPDEIVLVSSSGEEDIGQPHTRGESIVFPEHGEGFYPFGQLAHELFHVASRFEPSLRDRSYPLAGFAHFAPLAFPHDLEERRITNPDAPHLDCSIRVETPAGERDVVPILQAEDDLPTTLQGSIFPSLSEPHLLEVDLEAAALVTDEAGGAIVLRASETNYASVAAVNTEYVIHADEVLAENFALLVDRRRGVEVTASRPDVLDALESEISGR